MESNFNAHSQKPSTIQERKQSLIQYSRSPFEFPSTEYESYQENGTKYLKSLTPIPVALQERLNACAGEIFLSGIPPEIRAEAIAEIAAQLGELYILRYKVNFSGDSRGFAYLQYLNPSIMKVAIIRLPVLFRQHSLPMIRVRQSRNSSKLLLKKTYRIPPQSVYETLRQLITFDKLIGRELFPGYFEYQIIFKCNEEAVHARRELLRTISKFGRNAIVVWDTSKDGAEILTETDHMHQNGVNLCDTRSIGNIYVPKSNDSRTPDTLISPTMNAIDIVANDTSLEILKSTEYCSGAF